MPYQSLNPATGKTIEKFPELSATRFDGVLVTAARDEHKTEGSFAEQAAIMGKAAHFQQRGHEPDDARMQTFVNQKVVRSATAEAPL